MDRTLSEKILSEKAGCAVKAGDIVIVDVDTIFAGDISGPVAFREMAEMGLGRVAHPERVVALIDHCAPSPRAEYSREQQSLRQAAEKYGLRFYEIGSGICHQILLEDLAVPGGVTTGTDSHTCTAGALCSFATGMGAGDVAAAMGTGQTWLRVPETIEVRLRGKLPWGVYAKDVALELLRRLRVDGATYKALEFTGESVTDLTVSERATLASMAVEMGAKTGLFPSDEQTRAWLDGRGRGRQWMRIPCDPDAPYEATVEIDCSSQAPLIACPPQPDNVHSISAVKGTRIDQVFLGTCTNGRVDDLGVAARIIRGRKLHPGTRLIVVPASRAVMLESMQRGYLQDLVAAGAAVGVPGCGACVGMHMGVPSDGENVLSTQNRNFKGRMGNANAQVYLGSPASAAAAALTGVITDPREVLPQD